MKREATIERKTTETDIVLSINIDGTGLGTIDTGIPFMDHMLRLFAAHGFLDIELKASGDIEVDYHHTVEDVGICLGTAFKKALGDRSGIRRYGEACVPMDESLVRVALDLSNRPVLSYNVPLPVRPSGNFDVGLVKEFLRAFATHAGITLHVDLIHGQEPHHLAEAIFKSLARALDAAISLDERLSGRVRSTKGALETG